LQKKGFLSDDAVKEKSSSSVSGFGFMQSAEGKAAGCQQFAVARLTYHSNIPSYHFLIVELSNCQIVELPNKLS
jgi:hypothetical protein